MNEYYNDSNMSAYGSYRTATFSDIFPTADDFVTEYTGAELPVVLTADSNLSPTTLYYLLYANYGNSHIASSDTHRFKYKLFSIIWQYGPAVDKRLEIQSKLRNLTDAELQKGTKQIYNSAAHPGSQPETTTDVELEYIDQQNVTNTKRGKLEAYAYLDSLIKTDVVQEFIDRFKKLFIQYVEPTAPLLYGEAY